MRALIWYEKLQSPPTRGSIEESLAIMVKTRLVSADLLKTKALATALLIGSAKDPGEVAKEYTAIYAMIVNIFFPGQEDSVGKEATDAAKIMEAEANRVYKISVPEWMQEEAGVKPVSFKYTKSDDGSPGPKKGVKLDE